MNKIKTVDEYINSAEHWRDELVRLREILISTPLEETIKWGSPCYTYGSENILGLGSFKTYVGLWFFQGALLSDPKNVLINAQEGKTKAMRQWRFTSITQIKVRAIKSYINEAISIQQSGVKITPNRNKPIIIPNELQNALKQDNSAKIAFDQLAKGKQREYADYISDAKRSDTKLKRIDKIMPMIKQGEGLHDRYRK